MKKLKKYLWILWIFLVFKESQAQVLINTYGNNQFIYGNNGWLFTRQLPKNINLYMDRNDNTTIWINWTKPINAVNFTLYRNNTELYSGESTNYTDQGLEPDTYYYYNLSVLWNDTITTNHYLNATTMHNKEVIGQYAEDWNPFWIWATTLALIWIFIYAKGYKFLGSMLLFGNSLLGGYMFANAIVTMNIFITLTLAIVELLNVLKYAQKS